MGSDINKSHSYLALLLPEKMRVTLFLVVSMLAFSAANAGDCDKVFKGLYTWGAVLKVVICKQSILTLLESFATRCDCFCGSSDGTARSLRALPAS